MPFGGNVAFERRYRDSRHRRLPRMPRRQDARGVCRRDACGDAKAAMSTLRAPARVIAWLVVSASLLAGCGGGAGGGDGCSGGCEAASPNALTVAEVQQVIAQAVAEAQARGAKATIAVVDRVG